VYGHASKDLKLQCVKSSIRRFNKTQFESGTMRRETQLHAQKPAARLLAASRVLDSELQEART
jgi:hypothetical protein